jgi:DNA polymerase family A
LTVDCFCNYRGVWAVDFEFTIRPGGRSEPLCVVAREVRTNRLVRHWLAVSPPAQPPYPVGEDDLFVAYYASAELGCHLALGWPVPVRILDLYAEFRNLTNGRPTVCGNGLMGALTHFGEDAMEASEKDEMRQLAIRGGPYTSGEQAALLAYCEADVNALARLLVAMALTIDLPRALLRGRYMAAAASMEAAGIPIDEDIFRLLNDSWVSIKSRLVREIDQAYGVYVPAPQPPSEPGGLSCAAEGGLSFSSARWADYLVRANIPWPRLPTGALALDDDTFREMARAYPNQVGPMRELRHTLGQLRLHELEVGPDGRNRTILSAFRSRTGRNQPSNSKFVFGPSAWIRSLIRPGPGRALAYCDWSQQELAVAAALSGDPRMMEAYRSGDFYLTFARMAGAVPPDANKATHGRERDRFKTVALGVLYGLSADGLARKLGEAPFRGRELLALHRRTFRQFWEWSDAVEMEGMLRGQLRTVFGWTLHVGPDVNPRSLRNFPMQANGAEMMRLAACLATERGLTVCAPVHDAFLIESSAERIESDTAMMHRAMRDASEVVLPGFPLKTDAKIVRHPDRYSDPRGECMWAAVTRLLDDRSADTGQGPPRAEGPLPPVTRSPSHQWDPRPV